MELASLILRYSATASIIIASSITIVTIIRADHTTSTNKSVATTISLLVAAAAALTISSTLTGVLFWVMAPAALALSQIALCKAITGLFAEPHEYHESNTITYTMRTSEPARFHACVAVSGVRCPTE